MVDEDPSQELAALMSNGEGPALEFKRKLPESKQERHNVMKTVAAFANGGGGIILFGVEDEDSQVVGVTDASPPIRDRLVSVISDVVVPRPRVSIREYIQDGRVVLALHVERGGRRPYGIYPGKHEFYIRRGASTFPARQDEIRDRATDA